MTTTEFNKIVEDLMDRSRGVLIKKADEYNLTDDRLDVFKKAACRQMITVPQALLGYMDKHIGSIYDYVHEDKKMTAALAAEKITDAQNYLYLLYAILKEQGFANEENGGTH